MQKRRMVGSWASSFIALVTPVADASGDRLATVRRWLDRDGRVASTRIALSKAATHSPVAGFAEPASSHLPPYGFSRNMPAA